MFLSAYAVEGLEQWLALFVVGQKATACLPASFSRVVTDRPYKKPRMM